MNGNYICPICGYPELEETPYDKNDCPSYEICPCCGFEFGFDDESTGYSFESYRDEWMKKGCNWFSKNRKPKNWDCKKQLANIKNNDGE